MELEIDTRALDAFTDSLAEAAGRIDKYLESSSSKAQIKNGLDIIAKDARARVHNITGTLRSSIKSRVTVSADSPTLGEVGVSYKTSRAKYAHLVEGGHGGPHGPAAPHPFWEPALEATGEEALQFLQQVASELADEMLR